VYRPTSIPTGTLTSEELLRSARQGDPAGIGALYSQHADALFRTAYRIVGTRADAEDVVHDLFVGLPEALRRYEDHGQLGSWLNRIVVRLALMQMRAERRRRVTPLDETAVGSLHVAATGRTEASLEFMALQQLVMALPDELRTVFVLKQVEGYSHEEIGALLGISAGASRVRLSRALQMLRRLVRGTKSVR
jgi:RNA polymerase sigma-70 factor (ECF subfamily)